MNKNLTFGIYASLHSDTIGVTLPYVNYFSKWGNIRIINVLDDLENVKASIDILVVPGGPDVDSKRYNQKPHTLASNPNKDYEYLDQELLNYFIDSQRPIIGICRGIQSINVALGGTLIQHIKGHSQSEARGKTPQELYTDIDGYYIHKINSFHHQCLDKISDELKVIGWSNLYKTDAKQFGNKWKHYKYIYEVHEGAIIKSRSDYFVVPELVVGRKLPILGYQAHPEEFDCPLFNQLMEEFLNKNFNVTEKENQEKNISN